MSLRSSLREPSKRVVICVKRTSDRRVIHVSSFPNTYKNSFFLKKKTSNCLGWRPGCEPVARAGDPDMVRPGARRGEDDLGHVTNRTGRVQGRTVTASSRGMMGLHSTFNDPCTPSQLAPGTYYDPSARGLLPKYPIYRLGLVLLS
ncbi:hypothetical protein M9H77_13551 [Catharanthus roseus]|uniref:Uncharacterized protein n=1 Tax=Catharanthus roseus TaxID=4058 RepID=A0ACC0BKQ6_CATRO|nr:hypothetical protein M9H77_13551 [Catharanthus roseus]